MREKLIELLDNAPRGLRYEELPDYLLQNGVVVLPCKVGDVVYDISDNDVDETTVVGFTLMINSWVCQTTAGYLYVEQFNTSVFLTKEEAEKALEKLKNVQEHKNKRENKDRP